LRIGLAPHVAAAAVEFITGSLLASPRRIGRPLRDALSGIYRARLRREWCILYEVDQRKHVVIVLDMQHRSVAYRPR
jgi:mRNA-degrading endonuclease RelE of RelBE toxin-antitoxin system